MTTDKSNFFLISGAGSLGAVFVLGFTLRLSKRFIRQTIGLKIILLLLCVPLLLLGHALIEDREEEAGQEFSRQERSFALPGLPDDIARENWGVSRRAAESLHDIRTG